MYRRNADTEVRALERRYRESGSIEDLMVLNAANLRAGLPLIVASREQLRSYLRNKIQRGLPAGERNFRIEVASLDEVYTFDSLQAFHRAQERYGADPNYRVSNDFLGFEIRGNLLYKERLASDVSAVATDLSNEYKEVQQACHLLGWNTFYTELKFPNSDWASRLLEQVSYFLLGDEANPRSSKKISRVLLTHEAIHDEFLPANLSRSWGRSLDEDELLEAQRYEQNLHDLLDRAYLDRRLYIASPTLMQPSGYIALSRSQTLIADHMGRHETYLHYVLARLPTSHPTSPMFATWSYNIQGGGLGGGNYYLQNEYPQAVENYLKRVFRL